MEQVIERPKINGNRFAKVLISQELFAKVFKNNDEHVMFSVYDGIPCDSELHCIFMNEDNEVEIHFKSASFASISKRIDTPTILPKMKIYQEGHYWEKIPERSELSRAEMKLKLVNSEMEYDEKMSNIRKAFHHFGVAICIGVGFAVGLSALFHFMGWV